jgi:hypothetical protein
MNKIIYYENFTSNLVIHILEEKIYKYNINIILLYINEHIQLYRPI